MVFHETISLADRVYLSIIHRKYEGDVFFPTIPGEFVEVKREEIENTPPYSFVIYERKTMKRRMADSSLTTGFPPMMRRGSWPLLTEERWSTEN